MPRKPDWSQHVPDPRLTRYHGQVARLFRGDAEVGLLLVRIEPMARVLSGHLWWRRWARSRDVPQLFLIVDAAFSDTYLPEDAIEDELRNWQAGQFPYCDEVLLTQWVSEDEAAHLRRSQFGIEDDEL